MTRPKRATARMPVGFVGHGAPLLATDAIKGAELTAWSAQMPRPTGVLVVSAHWQRAPAALGAVTPQPLIYDFGGFPDALYKLRYPAPGAPALATRVRALLTGRPGAGDKTAVQTKRGLDHGAWVPLLHLYPKADVPVLQLSLPTSAGPGAMLAMGQALAPLRDEGVLILGSGNVTHNLRQLSFDAHAPTPGWARAFDGWTAERLNARDVDAIAAFIDHAPDPKLNHPTAEHWWPLLVAMSAAGDDAPSYPITGFEFGSISRRCVMWGARS